MLSNISAWLFVIISAYVFSRPVGVLANGHTPGNRAPGNIKQFAASKHTLKSRRDESIIANPQVKTPNPEGVK